METDAELLRRWEEGDEDAFAALHARWAPRLLRFLGLALGRSRAGWAEDCLQEAFLRIHRHADRYDGRHAFSTWLFTIARREAMRLHRRERLRATVPIPATDALQETTPVEDPELIAALDTLPAEVRSAILLVHLEQQGRRETAAILGIPERRVQHLCHQGITKLRKIIKKG